MKHDKSDNHSHHITPLSIYYKVWITLLVFTVITVLISYVDFGPMNLLIAMIVATIKAVLVMAFFMGLKYDKAESAIAFLSSFVFLGIFVSMTVADTFYRPAVDAALIDKSGAPVNSGPVDVKKVFAGTPEMKEKGKVLYTQNCATCHGTNGHGDGPAAAALNPKPRNFTQDAAWKNGRKLSQIFKTLTEGLPGTPMPSFAGLGVEDRFALAHYVQSLGATPPQDSESDIADLGLNKQSTAKEELSIEEGMKRYATDAATPDASGIAAAYRYAPGVTPRLQYCKGTGTWKPRWCQVNSYVP